MTRTDMTKEAIAEAFSRHAFAETYPHLAEDIRWDLIGDAPVEGRAAVVALCEDSAGRMAALGTRFVAFRVRSGADFVVVESTADYVESGGAVSRVVSCDLYTFAGEVVTEIVSYTVEA